MLGGCSGLISFDVTHDIAEQQVEGGALGGVLGGVVEIPLDIDLSAETAARDTGPAQHVYLTELSLAITPTAEPAGDTDDFDFLDAIEIFVESRQAGSTLPRQRIAVLDPVPRGVRRLELEPEGVDLIEYVQEGALLTSNARGTFPPDAVTFDGRIVLVVEVL